MDFYNSTDPCLQRMYPQVQEMEVPGEAIETAAPMRGCPQGYRTHTVAQGDTLSALAAAYQTTAAGIVAANPGVRIGTVLAVGMQLCIPPVRPCSGRLYVLRRGDTLYALARANGITVEDILAANPQLNPRFYRVGDTVCLPVKQQGTCPEGMQRYTVMAGDSWAGIAQLLDIAFGALQQANPGADLNTPPVPGTVLCVPANSAPYACPQGGAYRIEEGEGLAEVALKWNVTREALLAANPLYPPSYFAAGNSVCIPKRV